MKRHSRGALLLAVLGFIMFPVLVAAQNQSALPPIQKFAMVIGNSTYTTLTPLANPINDANDIASVLEHLGFSVDKVLNGTLEQMENAGSGKDRRQKKGSVGFCRVKVWGGWDTACWA